jgi:hypothetical protein
MTKLDRHWIKRLRVCGKLTISRKDLESWNACTTFDAPIKLLKQMQEDGIESAEITYSEK